MGEEVLEASSHPSSLLSQLHLLQQKNVHCDARLTAQGGGVPAHKVILMAASPFLNTRFSTKVQAEVGSKGSIHIQNMPLRLVESLVDFIYTGKLTFSKTDFEMMYKLCKDLDVTEALRLCENYINCEHIENDVDKNAETSFSRQQNVKVVYEPIVNDKRGLFKDIPLEKDAEITEKENDPLEAEQITEEDSVPYQHLVNDEPEKVDESGLTKVEFKNSGRPPSTRRGSVRGNKTSKRITRKNGAKSKQKQFGKTIKSKPTKLQKRKLKRASESNRKLDEMVLQPNIEENNSTLYDIADKGADIEIDIAQDSLNNDTAEHYHPSAEGEWRINETIKSEQTEHLDNSIVKKRRGRKRTVSDLGKDLKVKIKVRRYKQFPCSFCSRILTNQKRLAFHEFSKHGAPFDESRYTMYPCPTEFTQPADRSKLRKWSPIAMHSAYSMVMEGSNVSKAAKMHGIPVQTLRDRVNQKISIDCVKSGPDTLLSLEEEAKLCQHLQDLASVGYSYTRAEVINIASDYAVSLCKRTIDKPFTIKWYYNFCKRWPELNDVRSSSLSEQHARCASEESAANYFQELERLLQKYDLFDKPHNIYNIDEKGINTENKPPTIVCGKKLKGQAVMSERCNTVTIIGAGNASGSQIPPYFVFPGTVMMDGLMEGKTAGADSVMAPSGWSNSAVFQGYLQTQFGKYCKSTDTDPVLILYDGHRSHIPVDLIEWAKSQDIILFVLPPHTSHILHKMDIGCLGLWQPKYAQECASFAHSHHREVTKYDVCSLTCKAYSYALSPSNLQKSFKKAGIFPFKGSSITDNEGGNKMTDNEGENKITDNEGENKITDNEGENKITDNEGENKIADNEGENKMTDNEGENKITDNEGENKITDNEGENKITDNEGENKIADNEGENKITDNEGENNITDHEGENKTKPSTLYIASEEQEVNESWDNKKTENALKIYFEQRTSNRSNFRKWSSTAMHSAYRMVMEGSSVYTAAKMHGIPQQTLRDRVDQRISIDCVKSGPDPVLSLVEEAKLCQYLKDLASVGYSYTRAEVMNIASDYAVSLGKRTIDKPFTVKWFYGFLKRWPELNDMRSASLSEQHARCASEESATNYFQELKRLLQKYDLFDKPHNIYNIDEKGINTENKPPNIVCGKELKGQAVMSERCNTVTIIGAGNASGSQIPPYFVFPGTVMMDGLMEGKTAGADSVMAPSGWSNSAVFQGYLQTHFGKYCKSTDTDPVLILYDGHRSHIPVDIIEWAKSQNIILFVLPPHTSHILHKMDIGCLGLLQLNYALECAKFASFHHREVTKYDVCFLTCKAYSYALSCSNLQKSFEKAGIFPFTGTSVTVDEQEVDETGDNKKTENVEESILEQSGGDVSKTILNQKRKSVNSIVGGKALEGDTEKRMKIYLDESEKKLEQMKNKCDKTIKGNKKSKVNKSKKPKKTNEMVQPGTSGVEADVPMHLPTSSIDPQLSSESESESNIDESEKCCHCNKFYVNREDHGFVKLVKWIKCSNKMCKHWVHLKYCTELNEVCKNTIFYCTCCM